MHIYAVVGYYRYRGTLNQYQFHRHYYLCPIKDFQTYMVKKIPQTSNLVKLLHLSFEYFRVPLRYIVFLEMCSFVRPQHHLYSCSECSPLPAPATIL